MSNVSPTTDDPRVLTVDPDEPDVWIARNNSSAEKYHTHECATVEQMNNPKQVAQSVAEWNNRTKCARCHRHDTDEDYPRPGKGSVRIGNGYHSISPVKCLTMRALAMAGETHADAADVLGVAESTASRHISGHCTCDHYGHSVAYDADRNPKPAGDGGVPDSIRDGQTTIPPTACARIRRVLTDSPASVRPLAAVLGASDRTIRRHAKNADKCQHDHADEYPPVRWDRSAQRWVSDR